jgi:hypothetical protein
VHLGILCRDPYRYLYANVNAALAISGFTARNTPANTVLNGLLRTYTRAVPLLPPQFLFDPLHKKRLKLFLRIHSLSNQQNVYRVHGSLESFVS